MFRAQFVVIREAIEVAVIHLERLPPSDRPEELHARLQHCVQETEMWSAGWPTRRELDVLAKRVRALHVEVTKQSYQAQLDDMRSDSASTICWAGATD